MSHPLAGAARALRGLSGPAERAHVLSTGPGLRARRLRAAGSPSVADLPARPAHSHAELLCRRFLLLILRVIWPIDVRLSDRGRTVARRSCESLLKCNVSTSCFRDTAPAEADPHCATQGVPMASSYASIRQLYTHSGGGLRPGHSLRTALRALRDLAWGSLVR